MAQEDKLKKEIEMLGKMLGKLLTSLSGGGTRIPAEETLAEVKQVLKEQVALEWDLLLPPPEEELQQKLQTRKIDYEHIELLGNILYQLAENQEDPERARLLYAKAQLLFDRLSGPAIPYSLERHYKMEKIKKIL